MPARYKQLPLGQIANCDYCACMGRVVIPILSVVVAAAIAILSGIIAHDTFGIATDAIRSDALRSAGCVFAALAFGTLIRLSR